MPVQMRDAVDADMPRIFEIRTESLKNDFWTRVSYPNGRTQATIERGIADWKAELADPHSKLRVAVNTETSQVLAFIRWDFVTYPRPPSTKSKDEILRSLGPEANAEILRQFFVAKDQISAKHFEEQNHIYISHLCAHPDSQGKGFGSAALKDCTDICDEKGWPCFLAATEAGRVLYLRRGFHDFDEFVLDATPYGIAEQGRAGFMRREPVKT